MATLARASEIRVVESLPESDSPVAVAGPHRLMPLRAVACRWLAGPRAD
jgi:hypothetical protein